MAFFIPQPTHSRGDLLGSRLVWLLEIHLGSRKNILLAREPIAVPSAADGTWNFDGGLSEVTFSDSVDLFSVNESSRSVSIACIPPINIAEIVGQGFDLTTTTASLSQIVEGEDFSDRRPVFRNVRIRDPEYGADYEEFRFSLRSNPFEDQAMIPPLGHRVNDSTWPDASSSAYGRAYPQIFGQPGVKDTTAWNTFGSEALYVDTTGSTRRFLVAGHRCTEGSSVLITNETENVSDSAGPYAVYTAADGMGREVSLIDVPSSVSPMVLSSSGRYLVMWEGSTYSAGGRPTIEEDAAMHGAGDILRYMLSSANDVPIDAGRMEAAIPLLNEIRCDFTIDKPVKIWDWLKSNLLPLLPVSLATSGDGIYPIVWDREIPSGDVCATVDADRDVWERTSPVSMEFLEGQPINKFKITHSKNQNGGDLQEYSILDASRDTSDPLTDENIYAIISKTRYGLREKEDESVILYRAASAFQILSFWSRIYGFPIYSVEYLAPLEWGWLRAGAVIRITDPALHIENQLAIVQAIEWSASDLVGFRLSWLEDLPRDTRKTS